MAILPEVRLAEVEQFLDDVSSLVAWFGFWETLYNARAAYWSGVLRSALSAGDEEWRIAALERRIRDFRNWSMGCGDVLEAVEPCLAAVESWHERGMGPSEPRASRVVVTAAEEKALLGRGPRKVSREHD